MNFDFMSKFVYTLFDRLVFRKAALLLIVLLLVPVLVIIVFGVLFFKQHGVHRFQYEGFYLLFLLTFVHFLLVVTDLIYTPFMHYLSGVATRFSKQNNHFVGKQTKPMIPYVHVLLPVVMYGCVLGIAASPPDFRNAHTAGNYLLPYICLLFAGVIGVLAVSLSSGKSVFFAGVFLYHGPIVIVLLFSAMIYYIMHGKGGGDGSPGRTLSYMVGALTLAYIVFVFGVHGHHDDLWTANYPTQAAVAVGYMVLLYAMATLLTTFQSLESFFLKALAAEQHDQLGGKQSSTELENEYKVRFYEELFTEENQNNPQLPPANFGRHLQQQQQQHHQGDLLANSPLNGSSSTMRHIDAVKYMFVFLVVLLFPLHFYVKYTLLDGYSSDLTRLFIKLSKQSIDSVQNQHRHHQQVVTFENLIVFTMNFLLTIVVWFALVLTALLKLYFSTTVALVLGLAAGLLVFVPFVLLPALYFIWNRLFNRVPAAKQLSELRKVYRVEYTGTYMFMVAVACGVLAYINPSGGGTAAAGSVYHHQVETFLYTFCTTFFGLLCLLLAGSVFLWHGFPTAGAGEEAGGAMGMVEWLFETGTAISAAVHQRRNTLWLLAALGLLGLAGYTLAYVVRMQYFVAHDSGGAKARAFDAVINGADGLSLQSAAQRADTPAPAVYPGVLGFDWGTATGGGNPAAVDDPGNPVLATPNIQLV